MPIPYLKNKKFRIIFAVLAAWFSLVLFLVYFVFQIGIYSCSDAVASRIDEPTNSLIFNQAVETCRLHQDIGLYLTLAHFYLAPAIIAGFIFFEFGANLFPDLLYAGPIFMIAGSIPIVIIESYGITVLVRKIFYGERPWKSRQ